MPRSPPMLSSRLFVVRLVLWCVFAFLVRCCDVSYDCSVRIYPQFVCRAARVLLMSFVFACNMSWIYDRHGGCLIRGRNCLSFANIHGDVNNLFILLVGLREGVCLRSVSCIRYLDSVSGLHIRFFLTFPHLEMWETILSYIRYFCTWIILQFVLIMNKYTSFSMH